jgi:hypothetical protein
MSAQRIVDIAAPSASTEGGVPRESPFVTLVVTGEPG